jgi:hypothetical protein
MQKWEYLELNHAIYWSFKWGDTGGTFTELLNALNSLGMDGWEMCGQYGNKIILKRPIDPQPQVVNNTYNTYTTTVPAHPIDWHLPKVIC